jgi:hypothetical protein
MTRRVYFSGKPHTGASVILHTQESILRNFGARKLPERYVHILRVCGQCPCISFVVMSSRGIFSVYERAGAIGVDYAAAIVMLRA